jgi:hypothetical protein
VLTLFWPLCGRKVDWPCVFFVVMFGLLLKTVRLLFFISRFFFVFWCGFMWFFCKGYFPVFCSLLNITIRNSPACSRKKNGHADWAAKYRIEQKEKEKKERVLEEWEGFYPGDPESPSSWWTPWIQGRITPGWDFTWVCQNHKLSFSTTIWPHTHYISLVRTSRFA